MGITNALSKIKCANQGRNTGGYVNNSATGEVEAWDASAERRIQESSLSPDHVGHRCVDDDGPEDHEERHGTEFHALGKGSGDQSWSDDGEHQLVDHEGLRRDAGG